MRKVSSARSGPCATVTAHTSSIHRRKVARQASHGNVAPASTAVGPPRQNRCVGEHRGSRAITGGWTNREGRWAVPMIEHTGGGRRGAGGGGRGDTAWRGGGRPPRRARRPAGW